MKKAHKFVSFAAVALQLLSFLVFLIMVLFQRSFKPLFSSDPEVIHTFNFPIASTLYMLCVTVAILLILLGVFFKGRGIWAELICVVLLVAVCPLISRLGITLETALFVARRGTVYLAAFSSLQSLTNFATGITDVASALALVACGMGIALKKIGNH